MVTLEEYKQTITDIANGIAGSLPEENSYQLVNQIDAIQSRAGWDVVTILRNGLEDTLGLEYPLNTVWDAWVDYHRNKYGMLTAELIQEMYDHKHAEYIVALDPADVEDVTDVTSHFYSFVMGGYQAVKVTIHTVQSEVQALWLRHLFDVQRTLAHDHELDIPTDAIIAFEELMDVVPDIDHLQVEETE